MMKICSSSFWVKVLFVLQCMFVFQVYMRNHFSHPVDWRSEIPISYNKPIGRQHKVSLVFPRMTRWLLTTSSSPDSRWTSLESLHQDHFGYMCLGSWIAGRQWVKSRAAVRMKDLWARYTPLPHSHVSRDTQLWDCVVSKAKEWLVTREESISLRLCSLSLHLYLAPPTDTPRPTSQLRFPR